MPASAGALDEVRSRFAAALAQADVSAGVRTVLEAHEAGASVDQLVVDVLAPAQAEVGRRWAAGEWTVADEHAATTVTDAAITALDLDARSARQRPDGPRMVVACAENEWHGIPAKLVALFATHCGAHVVQLGAAMPAAALRSYLASADVDVLALSCTMPTNLLSARRCVAAAQDVGVPVIVGGRAFGGDGVRAAAIGADAWSSDVRRLLPLATATRSGAGSAREVLPDALVADAVETSLLLRVLAALEARHPEVAAMSEVAREATVDDLRWVARFTGAALACDDPRILDEMLDWLLRILDSRQVPRGPVVDGFDLLADALEEPAPAAAALLRRSITGLARTNGV